VRDGARYGVRGQPLPRVRAAVAWSPEVAELARKHDLDIFAASSAEKRSRLKSRLSRGRMEASRFYGDDL